jgi:hypothetical protein
MHEGCSRFSPLSPDDCLNCTLKSVMISSPPFAPSFVIYSYHINTTKQVGVAEERHLLNWEGGYQFEPRPGHQLFWLWFSWFSSIPPVKTVLIPRLGYHRFHPNSFQFINLPIIVLFDATECEIIRASCIKPQEIIIGMYAWQCIVNRSKTFKLSLVSFHLLRGLIIPSNERPLFQNLLPHSVCLLHSFIGPCVVIYSYGNLQFYC